MSQVVLVYIEFLLDTSELERDGGSCLVLRSPSLWGLRDGNGGGCEAHGTGSAQTYVSCYYFLKKGLFDGRSIPAKSSDYF